MKTKYLLFILIYYKIQYIIKIFNLRRRVFEERTWKTGSRNPRNEKGKIPRKGEIPGVVEQILGHGKLRVRCADGITRLSRIPGKMKKRIWIREGDVVLVKPWDFQSDEKADVIWRYTRTEANWLERRGYLNL